MDLRTAKKMAKPHAARYNFTDELNNHNLPQTGTFMDKMPAQSEKQKPKPVILIFGGMGSERKVSVASAQHLATIVPEASLWFWANSGEVLAVKHADLIQHKDPFMTEFMPQQPIKVASSMENALDQISRGTARDSIFLLALHGGDGENGWLQEKLESRKLFFTGSSSSASAHAMDKVRSKETVVARGVKVAKQLTLVPSKSGSHGALLDFQMSVKDIVIKPSADGSSAGLAFLSSPMECETWLTANKTSSSTWLVEEKITGRELTVGVIAHNGCLIVLPPSEVILERNAQFDYHGKYFGVGNKEITPADIAPTTTAAAQSIALIAHTAIGCFGYTRTDMILTDHGIYFLETNTLPGMTRASFMPQQLRAAGIAVQDFVSQQLMLAQQRYL